MNQNDITERLQQALIRLKEAANAVAWSDPDLMDERLLDELAEAVAAADEVLAGRPAAGATG